MASFWKKFIAGFVIGVGGIIPGFSGGILAVSMGLYKPAVDAITGFFKAPRKNFRFLFPLGLGGVIGFVVFMFLLDWLFADFRTYVICAFVGLVVGSLPALLRECNEQGYKKSYPLWSVLGFVIAGALITLSLITNAGAPRDITPLISAMCGAIIMGGVLLPGVSISFVLLTLGVYENFLHVFTDTPRNFIAALKAGGTFGEAFSGVAPNLLLMLCGLAGMLAVAVPVLLLIRKVIDKYHGPAYYLIFGVVIATTIGCIVQEVLTLAADPNYVFAWWKCIIYAALFAAGMLFSANTERLLKVKE